MEDAMHKVNYLDINKTGTRFMFLHRWKEPNGRFHRLITANSDGSDLYILKGDKMASHCCWLDESSILAYCFIKDLGEGYYRLEDKSNKIEFF